MLSHVVAAKTFVAAAGFAKKRDFARPHLFTATTATRPFSPETMDAPTGAPYAAKTVSEPSSESDSEPYASPVSGSVTPGMRMVRCRTAGAAVVNSFMYTAAILPCPIAVTPSPTWRTARLPRVIWSHGSFVVVPVAVAVFDADDVAVDVDVGLVLAVAVDVLVETDDLVVVAVALDDLVAVAVAVTDRIAVVVAVAVPDFVADAVAV